MKLKSVLVALATAAAALALAAPAAAATSGPETFVLLSTNPANNAPSSIAANGVLHARGVDVQVSSNSSGTAGVDSFRFAKGNLTVAHATTKGTAHDSFDRTTCLATHIERGTFKITGGTKAFAHASGSGGYSLSVLAIGCSQNKPPSVFQLVVSARGTLKF